MKFVMYTISRCPNQMRADVGANGRAPVVVFINHDTVHQMIASLGNCAIDEYGECFDCQFI